MLRVEFSQSLLQPTASVSMKKRDGAVGVDLIARARGSCFVEELDLRCEVGDSVAIAPNEGRKRPRDPRLPAKEPLVTVHLIEQQLEHP